MHRHLPIFLLAGLLLAGCSGSGQSGDGGTGDGDGGKPDYDDTNSILLTIPEGTSLCSGFSEGRTWQEELQMVGQIELVSGYYVLEREPGTNAAAGFIERVLFGPGRTEAVVQAETGSLETEHRGQPPYDEWIFTYRVPTRLDGKESEASFKLGVYPNEGVWPAEISLDADPLRWHASGEFHIEPDTDPGLHEQRFALCDLPDPPVREITATGANGHRIELTLKEGPYYDSCMLAGETQCYFLTRAAVKLGAYEADIEDRFRLIYNGSHHNWYDKYLLILDPPADDVHAVLAIAAGFNDNPPAEFVYLDADLEELSRESDVDWQETNQ